MKMTRTEWRYLQRIALDHPYYDTHALPLTEKEAKAIVDANITMTGREFVDSVYAKLGMTRPKEKKKRLAWLHGVGELFAVPPIRRIAIAVLIVILMTVFLAATPTGRAIAEDVIQYIVKLLDGKDVVVSRNESVPFIKGQRRFAVDDSPQTDNAARTTSVDSFEEFKSITGKTPFVLPMECDSLFYTEDGSELTLFSVYSTPKGRITAYQMWSEDEMIFCSSAVFRALDGDSGIYYSIKEENIDCTMTLEDSVFAIEAEGMFDLEEIISLLKQ